MGIHKRNKVSAEFSMSSLTDIIFLLLIFFMLTSTLVKLDAFELPESDSKTVAPTSIVVSIQKSGKLTLNGKPYRYSSLERAIRKEVQNADNRQSATVTIVAEKGVPWKDISKVVEMAGKLRVRAILATQPTKG
jgi:biopolymer transport protein ExbD